MRGTYPALITPFLPSGDLDEKGLIANLLDQAKACVEGVVVIGSTGESPTLSEAEEKRVIQLARENIAPSMKLIVGVGTNDTYKSVGKAKQAKVLGADGLMVVNPYYNKPSQKGLMAHFKAVAAASDLPLMLYNHLGRCGVNIEIKTLIELARIENIVAIKEASENLGQIDEMIYQIKRFRPSFAVLGGNDAATLPLIALGGDGVVSVLGNLMPKQMKQLTDLCLSGNFSLARKLHHRLIPYFQATFKETNPIPIKAMMQMASKAAGEPRLPLLPLSDEYSKAIFELVASLESDFCLETACGTH